ncbi:MAG: GNAT family N-acetyltransferase [Alphaproteobacteria bacterium]|nr:GNAT family N-acetyltransferase [Alphaproteobacteria bacterium]
MIRALRAEDTPAVVDLYDRLAADGTGGPLSAAAWERFLGFEVNQGGVGFRVAEEDGRLIGLATSSLRSPEGTPLRHFRVLVDLTRRREGVGGRLLWAITELDQALEAVTLQTLCPEAWATGRRFVEALGFAVVEEELEMRCEEAPARRSRVVEGLRVEPVAEPSAVADAVAALHNLAYAEDISFVPFTAPGMAELLVDAELWVARLDGALVGYAHLEADRGATWIESIVVDPAAQGKGVGQALGDAVLRQILDRGHAARLQVSSVNAGARRLYARLGFTLVARTYRYRAPWVAVRAALAGRR